jgi:YHYH protein
MRVAVALLAVALGVAVTVGAALAAADPTRLPLGDGKYTLTGPKRGWIYSCGPRMGGGGAMLDGPWIGNSTWNSRRKISVRGSVAWRSTTAFRATTATLFISGNGLPRHRTGVFPIRESDPAYRYDRNPNSIRAQSLGYAMFGTPKPAARPSCVDGGPIGVMLTGAVLFDGLDAEGRDAVAHELQDRCGGHPERTGQYHYHSLSPCADAGTSTTAHSKLVGYAVDGFGIYGPRGEGSKLLSNADLDVCHGHTHSLVWRGQTMRLFHYHATREYPYTIGCFRASPAR